MNIFVQEVPELGQCETYHSFMLLIVFELKCKLIFLAFVQNVLSLAYCYLAKI